MPREASDARAYLLNHMYLQYLLNQGQAFSKRYKTWNLRLKFKN